MGIKRLLVGTTLIGLLGVCAGCGSKSVVTDTQESLASVQTETSVEADVSADLVVGTWTLNMVETEKHLKTNESMQELFGTGLGLGNGLNLYEDHTMDYYIAIGVGGTGVYVINEDHTISMSINPYTEGEAKPEESLMLTPVTIDGITYLTMPCYDEIMYWEKSAESVKDETIEQATAKDETQNSVKTFLLENPSWEYYLAGEGVTSSETVPVLSERSTEPVSASDEGAWFSAHLLERFYFPYADEAYLYEVSGEDDYEPYILHLSDSASGQPIADYDFSNYRYADEYIEKDYDFICERICWAKAQDGVLYVAIAHNTYAASAPHTGYLVAVDIETGDILWKTAPLTSNSWSCTMVQGGIICGYGFTDEDDYLNVVDIHDGTIAQQIPLKTMAEYIIEKDNMIFVMTYNTGYVFDIK